MSHDQHAERPPRAYEEFCAEFPALREAWDSIRRAEAEGPLDPRTRRLVKLAASISARAQGGTHSATRKALAAGASEEEILQVVALCASLIGMPETVAAWSWVRDVLGPKSA